MESIAIIKIRLTGIIGCIGKYTSEPTITTITNSLMSAMTENNYEIILFACKEISIWYEGNISRIVSNNYVFNKESHIENMRAIKEIIADLDNYSDKYIEELSQLSKSSSITRVNIDTLQLLFNRFHKVVVQLRDRYKSRETLDINDEYDVQDLLHALLQLYCDDIRAEEWTPSYAGTCSRQDFLLKKEKIVIETKKTRKGLSNRELADQLIIDIDRYKKHPDCKTLLCCVYDPENRIKNPRGFENDLSKETDGMKVIVCIRP